MGFQPSSELSSTDGWWTQALKCTCFRVGVLCCLMRMVLYTPLKPTEIVARWSNSAIYYILVDWWRSNAVCIAGDQIGCECDAHHTAECRRSGSVLVMVMAITQRWTVCLAPAWLMCVANHYRTINTIVRCGLHALLWRPMSWSL